MKNAVPFAARLLESRGWLLLLAVSCQPRPPVETRRIDPRFLDLRFRVTRDNRPYNAGVCLCGWVECAPRVGASATPARENFKSPTAIRGGVLQVRRPEACHGSPVTLNVWYMVAADLDCSDEGFADHRVIAPQQDGVDLLARCTNPAYEPLIVAPPERSPDGQALAGPCPFSRIPICQSMPSPP